MSMTEPRYGSDQNGFVWGFAFKPGETAVMISADVAERLLKEHGGEQDKQFFWLHFSLANASALRWLQQHADLPEAFYEAIKNNDNGSTRLEREGDSLIAVVRDVLFDFAFDPADVSSVILCAQANLLVSARLKPLRSVENLREAVKAGETFQSPAELLSHLLRDQASVLVNIVRQSTYRCDIIEDSLLRNRIASSRVELGSLRRVLVRLQRLLAPEPAALFRLLNKPPGWISEEDLQDMRESAEEFAAAVSDTASLVERIRLVQEELAALVNEQNNRSLFILTVVTVLALPINLIAGLFGMNVGGIPLANSPHGFLSVIVLVAILTFTLGWLARRRNRD